MNAERTGFSRQNLLISAEDLNKAQQNESVLVVDCRFDLSDTDKGHRNYLHAHIPGAVYAHLDDDLSGPLTSDSGRHPLPAAEKFSGFLARSGWSAGTRLVVYDDGGGSIAARLWWLMKYFGHEDVALLDGGFPAWQSAGFELETGQSTIAAAEAVKLKSRDDMVVATKEILENLSVHGMTLVDVRAAERFNGEVEPIDSVAGHIPGSINFPFQQNLDTDGRFKPIAAIQQELHALQGARPSADLVFMCGSGVTACHTIFAAGLARLQGAKLYAGSWSEWIRDPSRPIMS